MVAKELFPQIGASSRWDTLLAVGIGFLVAIGAISTLNEIIRRIEDGSDLIWSALITNSVIDAMGEQKVLQNNYWPIDGRNDSDHNPSGEESKHPCESPNQASDNNTPILQLASQATASPSHRGKIRRRLGDIHSIIEAIERRAQRMHAAGHTAEAGIVECAQRVDSSENELCADQIDEHIHRLEYSLDHIRRFVRE